LQNVSIYSVKQSKTHTWTEEPKREHIKEHAKINVLANYKAKYEDFYFLIDIDPWVFIIPCYSESTVVQIQRVD
jgi:hypothetical protein